MFSAEYYSIKMGTCSLYILLFGRHFVYNIIALKHLANVHTVHVMYRHINQYHSAHHVPCTCSCSACIGCSVVPLK